MGKILTNIAVLLITLLIFTGALELALRLLTYQNPLWNKYHEYFVYTSNPGQTFVRYDSDMNRIEMTVNERGYRGDVIPYENTEGRKRIFVIGDSFVECFGPGLENCFTTVMQKSLGDRYEVIAYGTSSWALDNEYKVIEMEGLRYEPETVIVVYFLNDFWDASRDLVFSVENGTLVDNTPIEWGLSKKLFFHANQASYIVRFVTGTLGNFVSLDSLAKALGVSSFRSDDGMETVSWGIPKKIFEDVEVEEIEEVYYKTGLILDKYKELSEEKGFRLIFAIAPMKEQASDRYLKEFIEKFNLSENTDVNLPYDRITGMMKERGIEFIDARPMIRLEESRLEAEGESLYYEDDTHFNVLGQDMFGEIILDYLGE